MPDLALAVCRFSPDRAVADCLRVIANAGKGPPPVLPLEACLQYGGPVARAVEALAIKAPLTLHSPYLAAVAQGAVVEWNEVHRAQFHAFVRACDVAWVALPGATAVGASRLRSGFPDVEWRPLGAEATEAGADALTFATDALRCVFPELHRQLSREEVISLAQACSASSAFRSAREVEWEPWRAAGAWLPFLRQSGLVSRQRLELARREWARFECLFHPVDERRERASLRDGEAMLSPAAAVLALETGGGYAQGPTLWAVGRSRDDTLVEASLSPAQAALVDELAEGGRVPVSVLLERLERRHGGASTGAATSAATSAAFRIGWAGLCAAGIVISA